MYAQNNYFYISHCANNDYFCLFVKIIIQLFLRIALWVKNVFRILSWSGLKGSLSGFWTGVKVTTAADMSNEMQNIMLVVKSLTHHDTKTLPLKSKTLWQVNYDFGAEKHHHWCFRDFKIQDIFWHPQFCRNCMYTPTFSSMVFWFCCEYTLNNPFLKGNPVIFRWKKKILETMNL